jgi:CubicO group peptidase (beta-lactamase class C family)
VYSTGLTHVGATLLTQAVGAPLREHATQVLFEPLGIQVVRWDRDPSGVHLGGAEMYFVPRDLARFGELYLRNGTIDGTPIVDSVAVQNSTAQVIAPGAVDGTNGYGAWWWTRSFAGHPTFFAWGHGGTFIFVHRDLDAVVVVTSNPDVGYSASGANSSAVFQLLEQQILPAISP